MSQTSSYFYGEDTNVTALFGQKAPPIPAGYNFDFINADALVNKLSVNKGRLTTPSGMEYRLLTLDPHSRFMSLPVLRKIRDLVQAGAVVVGQKPVASPSLADDDAEFRRVVDELWGTGRGRRQVGQGTVYAGGSPEEVLSELRVDPDFSYTKPSADTSVLFVHRALPDGDSTTSTTGRTAARRSTPPSGCRVAHPSSGTRTAACARPSPIAKWAIARPLHSSSIRGTRCLSCSGGRPAVRRAPFRHPSRDRLRRCPAHGPSPFSRTAVRPTRSPSMTSSRGPKMPTRA